MHFTVMTLQLVAFATADETSRAVDIAAVGMLMVFSALALLTVFLTLLPRMLAWINIVWPETREHHALPDAEELLGDEDDVLAAIGYVLHAEGRELP